MNLETGKYLSRRVRDRLSPLAQTMHANNRMMKIHSVLICSSNNANARQLFLLVTPEISHQELQPSVSRKNMTLSTRNKAVILSHGNSFDAEGHHFFNFMTHTYVPKESVPQVLNVDESGQKLYED